jgi:hypothetical protein
MELIDGTEQDDLVVLFETGIADRVPDELGGHGSDVV